MEGKRISTRIAVITMRVSTLIAARHAVILMLSLSEVLVNTLGGLIKEHSRQALH